MLTHIRAVPGQFEIALDSAAMARPMHATGASDLRPEIANAVGTAASTHASPALEVDAIAPAPTPVIKIVTAPDTNGCFVAYSLANSMAINGTKRKSRYAGDPSAFSPMSAPDEATNVRLGADVS